MTIAKLNLPVLLLVPLLGVAAGAGGSYMVTKERVEVLGSTAKVNAEKIAELEKKSSQAEVQLTEVRTDVKHILRAVERVEGKLGTRP